jgi:hypothetical protein
MTIGLFQEDAKAFQPAARTVPRQKYVHAARPVFRRAPVRCARSKNLRVLSKLDSHIKRFLSVTVKGQVSTLGA